MNKGSVESEEYIICVVLFFMLCYVWMSIVEYVQYSTVLCCIFISLHCEATNIKPTYSYTSKIKINHNTNSFFPSLHISNMNIGKKNYHFTTSLTGT